MAVTNILIIFHTNFIPFWQILMHRGRIRLHNKALLGVFWSSVVKEFKLFFFYKIKLILCDFKDKLA